MKWKVFLLLLVGWLVGCQSPMALAQTVTGYVGDTLTVKRTIPPLGPGCYRDVLLGPTGAFFTRDTLCWKVKPLVPPIVVPPVPMDTAPSGRVVLFQADWSTATGNSQAALRDASKPLPFDVCEGQISGTGGDILYVVPATGLGFPPAMKNVLRVKRNNIDSWAFCRIGSTGTALVPHWPQLGIGQANYWRVYLRVDIPNSEGDISNAGLSHHPIQMPHNSNGFEPTNFFSRSDGTMTWQAYTFAPQNPFPQDKAVLGQFVSPSESGQRLPKFTALRIEWMVRRDTPTGFSIAFRIYNDANQLLWSEDGIGALKGAVMTERASAQVPLKALDGTYHADLTTLQSLGIGENGGWHSYSQDVFFYFGGLQLCSDTWCGPY